MQVLLVADVPNWAWDHKAKALKKHLKDDCDITVTYSDEVFRRGVKLNEFNSIHFFGWQEAYSFGVRYKLLHKISSAISSYNYSIRHSEESIGKLRVLGGITAVSAQLKIKLITEQANACIYQCSNGVDEEIFYPNKIKHKKFIVGWVGQQTSLPVDIKGYERILLPLVEHYKNNKKVEIKIVSNNHINAMTHQELAKFYNGIDLLISTSYREGTPNPVFEAAACGIPVLSTEVGCVPELISSGHNGLMVPAYDNDEEATNLVGKFIDNINIFVSNREYCEDMGKNNRTMIENNWTWKQRARDWLPVFKTHRIN